jgi:hypothetical protein
VDQRAVEQATRHGDVAQKAILSIQGEHMELLDGQITEPGRNPSHHVLGTLDPLCRGPKFANQPLAEFQGGQDPGSLRRADARCPNEFCRRPTNQLPQRAFDGEEEPRGHGDGILTGLAGAEDDGQEFDRGEG